MSEIVAHAIHQILNAYQVLDQLHPFPLEKDLPLLPSSQAKKKESQFRLWMVEQIIICQIPAYDIWF
jgi:hypothetical protein